MSRLVFLEAWGKMTLERIAAACKMAGEPWTGPWPLHGCSTQGIICASGCRCTSQLLSGGIGSSTAEGERTSKKRGFLSLLLFVWLGQVLIGSLSSVSSLARKWYRIILDTRLLSGGPWAERWCVCSRLGAPGKVGERHVSQEGWTYGKGMCYRARTLENNRCDKKGMSQSACALVWPLWLQPPHAEKTAVAKPPHILSFCVLPSSGSNILQGHTHLKWPDVLVCCSKMMNGSFSSQAMS